MSHTVLSNQEIHEKLTELTEPITTSPKLESRIRYEVKKKAFEKSAHPMTFTWKKAVVAACLVCLTTVTVYGGGKLAYLIGGSPAKAVYTEVPSQEEFTELMGFTPEIPEEFSNGYTFDGAVPVSMEGKDEQDNSIASWTAFDAEYQLDGSLIHLNVERPTESISIEGQVAETYHNIDLYYHNQSMKFLPADYEMTEQDREDEKNGIYQFSYGSDDVQVETFQHVTFTDAQGIHYSLYTNDTSVTEDMLLSMAKELIQ